MITPAIHSCPCLFDRCLPSVSNPFSSMIPRSFRQMGRRHSQTQRTGCRHQESQTRGPGPGFLLFFWSKAVGSYRRSLILNMPLAGNKSLVLFLCLISLLCLLLRPSGDGTPAACPPCVSARSVIAHVGPRTPEAHIPGTLHCLCIKAIKASKHQIRHLNASEEWRGFPPSLARVSSIRHLPPMATSEAARQHVPSSLLKKATPKHDVCLQLLSGLT